MSTPSTDFPIVEAQLADQLGIPRGTIRTIRDIRLKEGVDWFLVEKQIRLTEDAVPVIRAAYAALAGSIKTPPEGQHEEAPPMPADESCEPQAPPLAQKTALPVLEKTPPHPAGAEPFTVARLDCLSRLILRARPVQGDTTRLVLVRVKDTALFVPGMRIYATPVGGGVYAYAGRYPRWRGEQLYRPANP